MNIFDLTARIILDKKDYENGINDVHSKGSELVSKIGSAMGKAVEITSKAVVTTAGATAAAIGKMAKDAVSGFADYEQLAGGVETLFGTSAKSMQEYIKSAGGATAENIKQLQQKYLDLDKAQSIVMDNAAKAYETAGLSANEYMETVTGFSASLIQSLGGDTKKAAEVSDKAIVDMADNANKMGTSMESIQNAYQGFAKQNYTMLDNLKLGYGGTKEEMARLLTDADAINKKQGIITDYSMESFADIVEAIHVVQDNMGITGTTAREASETITGSLAMTKSAWKNLIAGLGNKDADMSSLMKNVVDSAKIAFNNILPVAEQALGGISELIREMAPEIAEELPKIVEIVLPAVISSTESILKSVADVMPTLLESVWEAVKGAFDSNGLGFVSDALERIYNAFAPVIETITNLVDTEGIASDASNLLATAFDNIASAVEVAASFISSLIEWTQSGSASFELFKAAVVGITTAVVAYTAVSKGLELAQNAMAVAQLALNAAMNANPFGIIVTVITGLVAAIVYLWNTNEGFRTALINAWASITTTISNAVNSIINFFTVKVPNAIQNALSALKKIPESALTWGRDLMDNFIAGITQKIQALKDKVGEVAQSVKDFLGFSEPKLGPLSNFHTYAPDMIDLFIKGISDNEGRLRAQIASTFDFGNVGEIGYTSVGTSQSGYNTQEATAAPNIVINVYDKQQDASELAREIMIEAKYGLMRGVAIG